MGQTRQVLLDAAARCLMAGEEDRLTMVDVASTAGVAKGTLYNHFRSQEELLRALVDREVNAALGAWEEALARRTPPGEPQSGAELADALDALAARMAEHPVLETLRRHRSPNLLRLAGAEDSAARHRLRTSLSAALGEEAGAVAESWLCAMVVCPPARQDRTRASRWLAGHAEPACAP